MRVLLIKMSSMGDVFHTFPALTDAMQNVPGLKVDWVVEKDFSEISTWHPIVDKVYQIELRKWRKHPLQYRNEIKTFFLKIKETEYDLVLDAQGLLKSAWVASKILAPKYGFDWRSAREPIASLFYHYKFGVDTSLHAVERLRQLFSATFKYHYEESKVDYHLNTELWEPLKGLLHKQYLVFLHGTTWDTKLWPDEYWVELILETCSQGLLVVLPWGNDIENERAFRLKRKAAEKGVQTDRISVLETKYSLLDMARLMKYSAGIVSVDTGLSHVAAALDVNMTVIYRVTDPIKIGALGRNVNWLVSPVASQYLKKFRNIEVEKRSLEGLEPDCVIAELGKMNHV